jgi:hypothetical protein
MMDKEAPIDKDAFELGHLILPMNIEKFFEIFMHINGEFGFVKYNTLKGHKDFKVEEIKEDENNKGIWSGE